MTRRTIRSRVEKIKQLAGIANSLLKRSPGGEEKALQASQEEVKLHKEVLRAIAHNNLRGGITPEEAAYEALATSTISFPRTY